MKTKLLLAVFFLGTMTLSVSAQAQSQSPAVRGKVPNNTMLGQSINAQLGGDEDDEGGSAPATPPPLVPKNPNGQKYEKDRITIVVRNNRHFGYHIGDVIALKFLIQADNDVLFDFGNLKQGTFKVTPQNFTLLPNTKPIVESAPSGSIANTTIYTITMQVQYLKKLEPELAFSMDISYALDPPADKKKIKWSMLTTPNFVISTTTLADTGDALLEGDMSPADVRQSWAMIPLLALGCFILVWYGGLKDLVRWLNRVRIARKAPPEVVAWKVFKKVFADARDYRQFTPVYAEKVASALRTYFNIASLTVEQIAQNRQNDTNVAPLVFVLSKCQSVIYARLDNPVVLTETEITHLEEAVSNLVPRQPIS